MKNQNTRNLPTSMDKQILGLPLTKRPLMAKSLDHLLPLYLQYEPTADRVLLDHAERGWCKLREMHRDVVVYRDPECREVLCRWPWYYSSKPTRRNRIITLNCYKWKAVWC